MPEWKRGIRANLDLARFTATRQEEIVEDLAQQLEDAYQDALARGLPDAEAAAFAWSQCPDWRQLSRDLGRSRRGAVDALGLAEARAHDAAIDVRRSTTVFAGLARDLLFAARMMRKAPGFTLAAVLTLALGIGANSTIFSVISATLLKALPFPEPDRLALIWQAGRDKRPESYNIVSAPIFWDWQRQNDVFERMAILDSAGRGYSLGATADRRESEQVSGVRVTSGFFAVLGVRPFLGRSFLPEEEMPGKNHVVVLSHGLWSRRYRADSAIVGTEIGIDGTPHTVVGVMPADFHFQFLSGDERELWVPAGWTKGDYDRGSNSFVAIGRLKPGVPMAQADAAMGTIQAGLARQHRDVLPSAAVVSLTGYGLENVQRISAVLLGAVGFVLLIACVNVANLMLARGAERRKELAVRRALGASRSRVVRQLLAESALLTALGGAVGLALASWGTTLLARVLPREFSALPLRPLGEIGLDARMIAFTLAVSAVSALLFGAVPALVAARLDPWLPLKEGGREAGHAGRNVLRHVLVAGEVALTLVVLVAAGLMIKSMVRLVSIDPGFDPRNVLVMDINLPQENLYYGPPGRPRFCEEIEDRLASLPGVRSASAAAHLPMRGNAGRGFNIEGRPAPRPEDEPGGSYSVVCPGYFKTLGVPVLKGREFVRQDTAGSDGVVLVNESLAREYFPNEDPVGRRITILADGTDRWLTIVGVVGNVRHWGLSQDVRPQLFRPYTQAGWPCMSIVVRTATSAGTFARTVRRAMASAEPDRALGSPTTMEQVLRGSVGSWRFPMVVLAAFAALALLLAAVGIVGVVGFAVTQRTNEIGIRMALGAGRSEVIWMIVRASMRWVLVGLAAGAGASVAASHLLSGLLYDVKPADPSTLALVAAVLAAVAAAASYVPARRVTKIDPLTALRTE